MRSGLIQRKTSETQVFVRVELDGSGKTSIQTGCGFLDHMLTLLGAHSRIDLEITCAGDTGVDYHHTTEDVGICLGLAIKEALGSKAGIARYGYMILPMDEALILSAVDLSQRGILCCELSLPSPKVGDFDTELCCEFWAAFARSLEAAVHIRQLSGSNTHHIIEGVFKSMARSLRQAVAVDRELMGEIPSTKGAL
ncbi:MAG TPA: imidazoleglycerol-phosphate dehydratase HisB [Candidatus Faeciplasma avium]|uniref:Imidazoleglycerol-phosphate dehydratase n=1 Tax=Candidatus Faeciplasma avium TaxID=2840798 RepID=A0A9D1T3Q9_9FIRM|nr:imidazoleglycerol-phosphate dehydratase HisB [Candidatus Faeciplasma avium]